MPVRRSINQLSQKLDKKISESGEYWLEKYPAWMGNHAGVVEVPDSNNMVYVRMQTGQVVRVFNNVAPNIRNWAVYVGRDKSQPNVLRVLESRWLFNIKETINYVVFHHRQHEFPSPDTVWVYRDQFMPLLVFPQGGMIAKLFGDIIYAPGMTSPIRIPDTMLDLTPYIPGSGATYVLVEILFDGEINYIVGENHPSREVLQHVGNLPTPSVSSIPVCVVILYEGQTDIRKDAEVRDIIDLRMFTSAGGDEHEHVVPSLDDLTDVVVPAPTEGQVLTWDDVGEEWIAQDPTGLTPIVEDLTPQVPPTVVDNHFDLAAIADGGGQLYWNGLLQRSDHYTMDMDGLGLTTDFDVEEPDTLVFVYTPVGGQTIPVTDPDAVHVNVANEFAGVPVLASPTGDEWMLVEDPNDGDLKKVVQLNEIGGAPYTITLDFEVGLTTNGQNQNRTSGGTYTSHAAYITVNMPISVYQLKWDVSSARTYTLKVYRGWQRNIVFMDLGGILTTGATAEVAWTPPSALLLMPGRWTFELTWDGAAAAVNDNTIDSSISGPNFFDMFSIERTQYNTTFDGAFSAAIKITGQIGKEVVT